MRSCGSYHQELSFVHHFVPIRVKHVEGDPEAGVRLWYQTEVRVRADRDRGTTAAFSDQHVHSLVKMQSRNRYSV